MPKRTHVSSNLVSLLEKLFYSLRDTPPAHQREANKHSMALSLNSCPTFLLLHTGFPLSPLFTSIHLLPIIYQPLFLAVYPWIFVQTGCPIYTDTPPPPITDNTRVRVLLDGYPYIMITITSIITIISITIIMMMIIIITTIITRSNFGPSCLFPAVIYTAVVLRFSTAVLLRLSSAVHHDQIHIV